MRTAALVCWAGLVLGTAVPCAAQDGAKSAAVTELNQLFSAYAGGDRDVVLSKLRTGEDCRRVRPGLVDASRAITAVWQRARAAFVLELANDVSQCAPQEFLDLISIGRAAVIGRPSILGADASDDAFELKWHLLAVSVLQREQAINALSIYVTTMERRYVNSPAAKAAHTKLDPRFELMRAIAAEQGIARTMSSVSVVDMPMQTVTDATAQQPTQKSTMSTSFSDSGRAIFLTQAQRALERAAAIPAIAPEALVRLAVVRFRQNELADALKTMERAAVPAADPTLKFWASLWKGRMLDALNRPADAQRAFQQAVDLWPASQAAGTGLALAHLKQNHRVEAAAEAARVQALPATAPDLWWTYSRGDARFIAPRFSELREAIK